MENICCGQKLASLSVNASRSHEPYVWELCDRVITCHLAFDADLSSDSGDIELTSIAPVVETQFKMFSFRQ